MLGSAVGTASRHRESESIAMFNPFRSTSDPWYMITKGLFLVFSVKASDPAARNGKILPSGEFITTAIFSGGQLRAEKIRLNATLAVITKSARAMLHFSRRFSN